MAKETDITSTSFLGSVWGKRARGLDVPEFDVFRSVTPEDVEYLRSRFPFLQLVSTEPSFGETVQLNFVTADSGWTIFDYGEAMSASPGIHLYGGNYAIQLDIGEEEEGGEGGGGTALPPRCWYDL